MSRSDLSPAPLALWRSTLLNAANALFRRNPIAKRKLSKLRKALETATHFDPPSPQFEPAFFALRSACQRAGLPFNSGRALGNAICGASLEQVELLLGAGDEVERASPQLRRSYVKAAIERVSPGILKALLDRGADPDDARFEEAPPLVLAARLRSIPVVQTLIQAGARLDAVDRHGVGAAMACLTSVTPERDVSPATAERLFFLLLDAGAPLYLPGQPKHPLFAAIQSNSAIAHRALELCPDPGAWIAHVKVLCEIKGEADDWIQTASLSVPFPSRALFCQIARQALSRAEQKSLDQTIERVERPASSSSSSARL